MIGGTALNGDGNEFTSGGLRLFLCALIDFAQLHCGIMLCLLLDGGNEIILCLLTGQAGNAFQRCKLLIFELLTGFLRFLHLCESAVKLLIFLVQRICFAVERLLFLSETALQLLGFVAALFDFAFGLTPIFVDFVLRFQDRLTFFCFSRLNSIVYDAGSFLFSAANFFFRNLLAVQVAYE